MKNKQGPTLFTRIIALFAVTLVPLVTAPVSLAATFYWDSDGNPAGDNTNTGAGLGGSGTWNTASNLWYNGATDVAWANSFANTAVFWGINQFLGSGALGPVNTVSLGTNISAGTLVFQNLGAGSYVINGANTLTLGSPALGVTPSIVVGGTATAYTGGNGAGALSAYSPGITAEIDAKISGTNGLAVYGGGTLILGNAANDYTGFTVINNGTVVISNGGALGASTTTVAVNGIAGFGLLGGQLLLSGGVTPVTLNRNLAIGGRGDNNVGAALITVGNNTTINGNLLFASNTETRIAAIGGNTIFNGTWTLAGGSGHVIYGVGNTFVNSLITNGAIANTGIIKTGSGFGSTMVLTNPNNNFISNTRIDSGNLRVSNAGALGSTTTINQVSFNGGTLELRVDPANVAAFANVYISTVSNSGTIYVNRDVGGSGLNQTITTFVNMTASRALTMTGGDGYGLTVTNIYGNLGGAGAGNETYTNNGNGMFTINASVGIGDIVATFTARTLTLNGNGDGVLNGSIVSQGTADQNLTKSSNNTWTISGTNSTYTGGTFVNAGTLAVRSIGNASSGGLNGQAGGVLNIGLTTTFGAFDYLGAAGTGAGETTTKTLNMGGSTAGSIILADQAGASPSALILAGGIGNTGAGAKTLYLGGNASSSIVNEFHGVISDNVVTGASIFNTGLTKIGGSTWLYTPDASLYVTTQTTGPSNQTTSANAVINQAQIQVGSTAGLAVGQVVSGTNIPAGSFITQINSGTTITINNNITTQVNSGTVLTFTAIASNSVTTAVGAANSNVITVADTSTLRVGQVVTGVNIPNNSIITQILSPTTFTISNNIATAVANATPLAFGQINNFTGNVTISNGTLAIRPTAASGAGSDVINNTSLINFAADTLTANQTAGGTFEYQGFSTGSTENVGALSSQAGANTVKVTPGAGGTTQLIFSGLGSVNQGSTINFVSSGSGSITLTGVPNGFVDSHLFFNGADFAYATGGVVGAPVYGGADTNFSAPSGTSLTDYTHNEVTGSFTVNMDPSFEYILSLKMVGNDTLTVASGSTLQIENVGAGSGGSGSGILQTGGAGVITGGDALSTAGAELIVRVNGVGDSLTIATPTDGSVFGVTKSGAGTLTLVGAQGYFNGTTVNEGTLKLKNTTAGSFDFTLGSSFGATSSNFLTVRQGAVLDLNGAGITALSAGTVVTSGTVVAAGTFNGAGTVTNSAAGTLATLSVGGAVGGVFSGVIQDGAGQVGLNKYGAGILALTGSNTFTGPVTINDSGSLWVTSLADIGVASGLGKGDATNAASNAGSLIFNNGTLKYTGSDNSQSSNGVSIYQTTQSASVSTNRLFTIAGVFGGIDSSGTYGNDVLAAANTAGTANNAAIVFSNTGDIQYSGSISVRQLQLLGNSQGDNTMRLHLIDDGATPLYVLKGGIGLWDLNPATANTYSGQTEIDGGVLRAQDGLGLSSNSALVLAAAVVGTAGVTNSTATGNGVLESSGTFTRSIGEGAGQVSWGGTGAGGFAASSAPLTVALGGVVTPTQVVWATTDNPGAGGMLILNSATALSYVNFTNPINLNSSTATIFVDDNTSTTTDFAILSGVISGTSSASQLVKVGNGLVYLTGANTYQGSTFINSGTVGITSFGSSTSPASSSIGAWSAGASLNLGNGGTGAYLLYTGNGEVTDRLVNIASTTGTITIEASGGGALVLKNVAITGSGSKTLILRGFNTDNNAITSNLGNVGGNFLLQKQDGGTWILSGDNTFAGGITIGAGFVGVTATHATGSSLGTGLITISNGGIFSLDGAVTIGNAVQINNNTTWVLTGNYSQTYTGTINGQSGNPWTINNTITNGGILTFSSTANFVNQDTGTSRTLTFSGTGNTVYNGVIANSTGAGLTQLQLSMASTGTLTLGNTANTFTNGIIINQGTFLIGAAAGAGDTATSGRLGAVVATNIINFNGGVIQGTVPLTGTNKILNPTILNGNIATVSGTNSIEFGGSFTNNNGNRLLINNLSGGALLTFSGGINLSQDATSRTFGLLGTGDTLVSGAIVNGSTSTAGVLNYFSTGTMTLTAANNFGGLFTITTGNVVVSGAAGAIAGTSGIVIDSSGTFKLDNVATNLNNRIGGRAVTLQGGTFTLATNAGGTTEVDGILTVNSVASTITISGSSASTLTFASLAFGTGGLLMVNGVTGLGTTNKITFTTPPAAVPATTGIIARVIIDGSNFATYDTVGTAGLIGFAGYTSTTNIDTAGTTATLDITANATGNTIKTINGFRINGNGISVNGSGYLTLTSGGLLVTGGANTINLPELAFGGTVGVVSVNSGSTLNLNGALFGTGGFIKGSGGILNVNAKQYMAGTSVLADGTTVLGAGLNTLYQNQQYNFGTNAILDLNGNIQFMGTLAGTVTVPDSAGTITSNVGSGILLVNENASSSWGGHLNDGTSGTLSFVRSQGNTLTLESSSNFSGPALLLGGTTTLQDNATWLNVASIDLNYATFNIANNGNLQTDNLNRINDAAPITMRGAQFNWTGRAFDTSTETFGSLTIAEGANGVLIQSGNAGSYFSGAATFASLLRPNNSGATVNFTTNNTLGSENNNAQIYFTTAPTLQQSNAIGAWAIANTQDYATYNPVQGLGAIGGPGYQPYDVDFGNHHITNLLSTNTNLATNLTAPSTSTGLLRLSGIFNSDITFSSASNILNLQEGGILHANTSGWSTIGTTGTRGFVTAGGTNPSGNTELVVYNNNGTGNTLTGQTLALNLPNATVSGSNVLAVTSIGSIAVGNVVVLAGVLPAGTVVTAVDPINLLVTLSQPALTTTNGGSFVFTTNISQAFTGAATNSTVLGSTTLSMTAFGQAVQPGMIVTGTNIPVGTTVVAVNTVLNTVTLSQAATATGNAGTYTFLGTDNVNGSVVINSVIEDTHVATGSGTGTTSLVKSGAGVMVLTAPNTYTGGTIVDQGILYLKGGPSTVVIPFSTNGLVINGSTPGATVTVQEVTNPGQIDPANTVTFNGGGGILTLVGNNTLAALVFNNDGNNTAATVNTAGILTLTSSSPITATSINPGSTPIINGTLAIGSGVNTMSIGGIKPLGQLVTTISPTLNIAANILGTGSILKTSDGILQLSSSTSTFSGGIHVTNGGLMFSNNSVQTTSGDGNLVSGPLGIGTLTMDAGTRLLIDTASRTVSNTVVFNGDPIFDTTATTAVTMTLNGTITLSPVAGVFTASVANPNLTVALLGKITNIASVTTINKTGLGNLIMNLDGFAGNINAGEGPLFLNMDGNGTGDRETLTLGNITFNAGVIPNITIGRDGSTLPFTLAADKIIAPTSLSSIAAGVTVTNNNQYGLKIPDAVNFGTNAVVITVTLGTGSVSGSNVVPGLILSGQLSGTPTTFTKAGNGTVQLTNTGNNFAVGNNFIDITAGIVSVDADGELGAGTNNVRISTNLATGAGLRATGTFATNRAINFNAATNAIEVASSNPLSTPPTLGGTPTPSTPYILTLNSAFTFGTGGVTDALQKNDNGILEINASNPTWTGTLTIAAGAVRVSNAGALGVAANATTVSNTQGAALQLNGVSTAELLTLNNTGINTLGALEAVANATPSTASGVITLASATAIGADTGAVLNLTGGLTGAQTLTLSGGGTINITTAAVGAIGAITKIGTGTVNLQVASAAFVSNLVVSNGTFEFSGAGTIGGTGTVTVQAGGTLFIDNSGTNVNSRLAGRALSLTGGTINYTGSSTATSTETVGAVTLNTGGVNTFNLNQGAGQQTNFNMGALTRNQGTTILVNSANLATAVAAGKTTFTIASGVTASGAGANGANNKAVIPYGVVFDGTNYAFAVLDSAAPTFVRGLVAGTETTTTLGTAGTNLLLNGTNPTATTTASISYNSLTLNNGTLAINGFTTLTMGTSNVIGAILAYGGGANRIMGGTQGVNGATATGTGFITTGNNTEIIFHVEGTGTTLQVDSVIGNTAGGLTKDGVGTLLLTAQEMYTSTTAITQGILQLGTNNVIRWNQNLRLENSGALDLNGYTQTVAIFLNDVTQPDSTGAAVGGRIINSSNATTATFVSVNDNTARNWAGVIGGGAGLNNIAWERAGINTLSVFSNNDYTGVTALLGGTTLIRDDGALSGTSQITIGYATLQIDNNTSISNSNDRINDSAAIIMKGGSITYVGRTQTASSEVMGKVTLAEGANTIQSGLAANTGISSADLYFSSLDTTRGLGATVNFVQGTVANGLGVIGNNPRIHFLTAPSQVDNILGAWAIVNSSDYATYATDFGVGAVGQTGFRAYDTVFAPGNVTQITTTTNLTAPVTTTGALRISSAVLTDITFSAAGNALNLELGGLLHSNNAAMTTIGTPSVRGVLTAGGSALTGNTELIAYSANTTFTNTGAAAGSTTRGSNTLNLVAVTNIVVGQTITGPFIPVGTTVTAINGTTITLSNPAVGSNINGTFTFFSNTIINSVIADTSTVLGAGSATVSFVKSGSGMLTLTAPNTYHGGTVVDQGTLNLQGGPGTVVIPGDLTINGGTTATAASVNMVNNSGQIATTSNITINGDGMLFTTGNNTFNSLTFNNDGGNPIQLPTNINPILNAQWTNPLITTLWQGLNGYQTGGIVYVNGALTLTSNTINVTSSNSGAVATLAGRADFGANTVTINTTPITFNGSSIAPLEATFALMGVYGSSGGITLAGSGTVEFLAQDTYTGPTHLTGTTTMLLGEYNAGSRNSALILDSGTTLNLMGVSTILGSLSGTGLVTNAATNTASTLTVGYDNTDTTFSGQINRYNDSLPAAVNMVKIGSGRMIFDSAASWSLNPSNVLVGQASTGTFTVQGGQVAYTGSGTSGFSSYTLAYGGALVLDDGSGGTPGAGTHLDNRLNYTTGVGTVNINGGTLAMYGNSGSTTSEQISTVTINSGTGTILLSPAGNALTLTTQNLTAIVAGGTLILRNLDPNNAKFVPTTPNVPGSQGATANGTATMPIRPDIIADTVATGFTTNLAFATKDTSTGSLRPLISGTEMLTTITPAGSSTTNYTLNASETFTTASQLANSLRLESGINITGALPNSTVPSIYNVAGALLAENVTTGGILALGGTSNFNMGQLTTTDNNLYFYTATAGTTINVNAFIGPISNLTKSLDGTVILNKNAYYNSTTTVNGGKLVLNAGNNTLLVNPSASAGNVATLTALQLNGTGILDLNGNNQAFSTLNSNNPLPGMGGSITNSNVSTHVSLVTVNNSTQTFGGTIDGNLDFYKYGNSNFFLTSAESYNGATVVGGAGLFMRDNGVLTNSTSITANYGTFEIDNSGLTPTTTVMPNRIPNVTNVTLKGGNFFVNGGGTLDTIITLPKLTLQDGMNSLTLQPAIDAGSTIIVTINNLDHSASASSVLNINAFVGQRVISGTTSPANYGVNTLGQQNLLFSSNVFINNINGTPFSSANLVNNLIGGWVAANGGSFATYNDTYGVGALGQDPSFPTYDGGDITAATTSAFNLNDTTTRTLTGSKTINSYQFGANTLTLATATTLTLNVGIFTNNGGTSTILGTDATSKLTSNAGSTLYMYFNQGTNVISADITGNIDLVKEGGGTLTLSPTFTTGATLVTGAVTQNYANDYTGTTYLQTGTTNLNAAANVIVIPHDLVVNNGTVTMAANGQIAATSNVSLNGASVLTLFNAAAATTTTLASLSFNNPGGTAAPTFSMGTPTAQHNLVLTAQNAITATNDNWGFTPVITTGAAALSGLQFAFAGSPTITVNGNSPVGLAIAVPITSANGAINKNGTGALVLSAASTFTNGFNLNQGALIFGASSTLSAVGSTVINGPVGTGTLTLGDGTPGSKVALQSDTAVRTIANNIVMQGDVTFQGQLAAQNLTLNGLVNMGNAVRTFTVSSAQVTATIGGQITSGPNGGLIKDGLGTLLLNNTSTVTPNNYSGPTTINAGLLKLGANNNIPTASALTVATNAALDLAGFSQTVSRLNGGSGALITNSSTTVGSTLNVTGPGASTYAGIIDSNSATASLSITVNLSGGTLTLSNTASNYAGGTNVNGGTLVLNGGSNTAVVTGTGLLTVNAGILTGSGGVAANLILNSGANVNILANTVTPTSAPITTVQTLLVNGSTVINLTNGAPLTAGTYTLLDYTTGSLSAAQFANLSLGTVPANSGFTYSLQNNTGNTSVDLVVTAVPPNTPQTLTWTGNNNSSWDTSTANNWTNGSPAIYTEGSDVTFNNSGTRKVVTGSTPVAPNSITVTSNPTGAGPTALFNAYKISTPITGPMAGGLTKNGTSNLMLSGANTFTGPISVQGGLLEAVVTSSGTGLASGLGHGAVTLAAGTTLQIDATANTSTTGLNGRAFVSPSGITSALNFNATANDSSTYFATSTNFGTTNNLDTGAGGGGTNYSGSGAPLATSNLFAIQWTGKIKITNSGYYSFFDNSDDGSRVLIDGAIVAQNDRGGGTTTNGGASSVFLTAGLHDIVVQEEQGTGGWRTTVQYNGADTNGALAIVSANVLFTPETASTAGASNAINLGNNVTTTGSATINLNGTNFTAVQVGTLTPAVGTTLTVNGLAGKQLRATSTNLATAGTYTINTAGADVAPGAVNDNGNAITLAKTGSGRVIFDAVGFNGQSSLTAASTIDVQAGKVILKGMAFGGANPIGAAQIKLSGGILTLDSQGGSVTYDNAVTVTANNTLIEAVTEGQTLTLGGNTNGISIGGNNVTLDTYGGVRSAVGLNGFQAGATLNVAGAITGSGNITVRSTQLGLGSNLQPVNGALVLSANDNGFTGSLSILGEMSVMQGLTGSGPTNSQMSYENVTLNNNGSLLNIAGSTGSGGTLLLRNAQLIIDDTVVNNQNRIADAQVINMNQSSIQLNANTTLGTTEAVGTINLSSGLNQLRASNVVATLATVFQGANLVRANGSTLQFFTSATTLGGNSLNTPQFKFTQINGLSPTSIAATQTGANVLVGGSSTAGSKNIGIIPWAVGISTAVASTPTYSFVTYDANGIRVLNTGTEYNTSAAAATGDNARDTGSANAAIAGGKTINAWILDNTSTTAAITYTLGANMTITTGALMFTNTTTSTTAAQAITLTGSNVTFGQEGLIYVMNTAGATISSTLTGTGGLTVSGIGQLTLNANNAATLTGTVTVNGTVLAINADNNLGAATNGLQFGGGYLKFAATGLSLANTRTINLLANSFGGFDTSSFAGTVNGQIIGSGDLVKWGSNNLTLNNTSANANTFTGRILINGGGIIVSSTQINTSSGIVNNGNTGLTNTTGGMIFSETTGGAFSYNGNISGTGSVVINLAAAGTFTFGGVNSYGGATSIASANTTLIGNDQNLNGFITTNANTTSGVQFTQATNATSFATVAGSGFLTKTGAGVLTMVNASSYTGLTTITGTNAGAGTSGGLSVSAANQLGTGGLSIGGNGMLQATTAQFATSAVTVDFGTRALAVTAGGATFDVGTFTNGYDVDTAVNVLKIGGVISGTTSDAITKTGTGTLIFSGANTYNDNTVVSAGTLQLGASEVIPDGATKGNVTLAGGAVLDLNSFNETVNGLSGAGTVDDTAPATISTLTVGGNDQTASFSGVIKNSGAGSTVNLVKVGAGTETLSGANTYVGKTSIQNGALSVTTLNSVSGGSASSSLGAPTTIANGTIDFGGTGTTGTLIVTGAGGETTDRVVNFAGANGGATIENDATAPETFTSDTTGTGTGTNTFTLQGSNTGANAFNGKIVDTTTGATSLVKSGTGNWAINNANNNYTGATTISSGNLQVGTNGVGQTGSGPLTANGGTLSGTGTVQGAATINSGATLSPGDSFGNGVGNLKFGSSLTLVSGSSTTMQINSPTLNDTGILTAYAAGQSTYAAYLNSHASTYDAAAVPAGSHDVISVAGLLTLNSGSPINVGGTYTGGSGDVIDLLDWASLVAGGFNPGGDVNGYRGGGLAGNLTLPNLSAGMQYDVSHFLSEGFIVVVPEPGRAMLMMFGVAMLFLRRRRRVE